ncbi:MAG: DUF2225 domain-containing protein [bacterium]|nr:DUF2225 domain-containing protein [bacterium]
MNKKFLMEKDVKCPNCQSGNKLVYPNPKMYAVATRDDDQRVTSYSWVGGAKTNMLPHHYSVFQCSNCLLADFKEKFEDSASPSSRDKSVYEALQCASFDRRIGFRKLRRLLPKEELDVRGAMALHLSALMATLLPENKKEIDHMKLGRFALRVAWLYREINGPMDAKEVPESEILSATLDKLSASVDALQHNTREFSEDFGDIRKLSETRAEELHLAKGDNLYTHLTKEVWEDLSKLLQGLTKFQRTITKDKQGALSGASPTGKSGNTLDQLLPSLLVQCPQLPPDELSAIKLAVEAFDYSIRFEDSGLNLGQNMVVINLITKLLVKINQLEKALDYITQIFKQGFRDKQDLTLKANHGKRDKSLSDSQIKLINRQICTINSTLSSAAENRRKISSLIFERDKDGIMAALNSKNEGTPDDQIKALLDAGFLQDLIPWLKEKQLIKEEIKKKKWFGS